MKPETLLKAEAPSSEVQLLAGAAHSLLKARVSSYTRKDGVFVAEHDRRGQPGAKPKASGGKYAVAYPKDEKKKAISLLNDDCRDPLDPTEVKNHAEWAVEQAAEGNPKYTHAYAAHALRHAGRLLQERAGKAEKAGNLNGAKVFHNAGAKMIAAAEREARKSGHGGA